MVVTSKPPTDNRMTKLTNILTSILLLTFTQCADKPDPYKDFKLPDNKEFNQIILSILKQDTVFINRGLLKSKYIDADLWPTKIKMDRKRDTAQIAMIEPGIFGTSFLELKYRHVTDSINQDADSLYFSFQNQINKPIPIDTTIINSAKFATQEVKDKNKKSNIFGYFQFSVPILNKDNTKALVRTDFVCSGLCGQGMVYVLEKKNGKWEIVLAKIEWVS
jgi:hypothetical protein